MSNWVFALIALGVGLGIALYIDRVKDRDGEQEPMSERSKWLYVWFTGRFPPAEDKDREDGRKKKKGD